MKASELIIAPNGLPETTDWLFPEYDFAAMDTETYSGVVIERVLERGTWAEINWMFDRYGDVRVAEWVRRHGFRLLSRRSFALWQLVLDVQDYVAPDWAVEAKAMGW